MRTTFYVNSNGAIVLLRKLGTDDNRFNFRVRVTDQRNPEKTDDAQVTITVTHFGGPPVFRNLPYEREVSLARDVNNIAILTVLAEDPDTDAVSCFL